MERELSCLQMKFMLLTREREIEKELVKTIYYKYFRNFEFTRGWLHCQHSEPKGITLVLSYDEIIYDIYIKFNYRENSLLSFGLSATTYNHVVFEIQDALPRKYIKTEEYKNVVQFINDEIVENQKNICAFISRYYKKLYDTQHYNNLLKARTFLVISNHTIFPKDIVKLIYFRILFFIFKRKKKK